MPIYNGSVKQKDLYYGGTKIKEAYYGNTKVYSSGPSYFCYKSSNMYLYATEKPPVNSQDFLYTFSYVNSSYSKANSVSDLQNTNSLYIYGSTGDSFTLFYVGTFTYYPSGDL